MLILPYPHVAVSAFCIFNGVTIFDSVFTPTLPHGRKHRHLNINETLVQMSLHLRLIKQKLARGDTIDDRCCKGNGAIATSRLHLHIHVLQIDLCLFGTRKCSNLFLGVCTNRRIHAVIDRLRQPAVPQRCSRSANAHELKSEEACLTSSLVVSFPCVSFLDGTVFFLSFFGGLSHEFRS